MKLISKAGGYTVLQSLRFALRNNLFEISQSQASRICAFLKNFSPLALIYKFIQSICIPFVFQGQTGRMLKAHSVVGLIFTRNFRVGLDALGSCDIVHFA